MGKKLIQFIRNLFQSEDLIPLHEPFFDEEEKEFLIKAMDSTFVSSTGPLVNQFEKEIAKFTGSKYAIATSNGSSALHTALILEGVSKGEEVLTQSLTFVATVNAIHYCGALPVFLDVDKKNLGLSASSLEEFLEEYGEIRDDGFCWNISTGKKISACLPMHTYGLSLEIQKIKVICNKFNIPLIEDAAESLGTKIDNSHSGTFGDIGVLSFNGNKIMTTGGGGMILTNDENKASRARHLTTTARIEDGRNFDHDEVGFNYRLPNLNASLGLAQIKKMPLFIKEKREIASCYQQWGKENGFEFLEESENTESNYWLNTLVSKDLNERDHLLKETNEAQVMTRPAWKPMHLLSFNSQFQTDSLINTQWLFERIVNVPSSVRKND